MEYTEKYKLRQPEQKDSYDVDDFNYNSMVIDENLSKIREDYDAHAADKKNPHNVTKSQVGLDKVPNVPTNNQTPTYTEASTLETLKSGEMLATAFGKIKKAITEFINHKNSKSNPHAVTKSQVGLGNVPNVTTNNQTPTYTEAATLVMLSSGEYLSTALGKIKKAISDLISHINNKTNPHTVTKSQVGLGNVDNTSDKNKPISEKTQAALDGKVSIKYKHYTGVCGTEANNPEKYISTDDTFELVDGATITVLFETLDSTYGTKKLNVNGTGEKEVWESINEGFPYALPGYATFIYSTAIDAYMLIDATSNMLARDTMYQLELVRDAKKRSVTLVVGTASHASNDVNYQCTGTADQGQINSAIAALPSSGGKIVLLEGKYNISGSITVNKPNVTIEGMGNGTVLQTSSNISAINVSSSNCKLRNLSLTCTASDRCGNGIYVTGSYPTIENVQITHFEHNIYLAPGSDYAIVTKCRLSDGEGVCVRSKYCIISDNFIENHDWAGIYLYGPSYCNITGNILKDTGYGIFSQAAETQYNKISNNYILRGTGTSADYPSGKYTIYIVAGTYNYFSDNYIPGKNYVNNAGNTNTFTNNRYS